MYSQKRVKGGRIPTGSSLIKASRKWVESQARMFNVSKSFVVATAIAHMASIKEQEDYKTVSRRKKEN